MKNCYIDLHVVQTVPPSCINRDDTGSPKTAIYGGTMRARVSSQAWKHSMRHMFKDLFDSDMLGYRTKKINDLITEEILTIQPDMSRDDASSLSKDVLKLVGIGGNSDKKEVLFFISTLQIKAIADLAVKYYNEVEKKENKDKKYKKYLEEALKENPSIDILLFGRMAASNPSLNYDAAAQVAHSISTHTISNEYDYFTAVDDCSTEDSSGAGHLGTVEYNSSTLYRYATLNVRELYENLESEELKLAVLGFTEAFIRSMPTGKQNTFANRTLPSMVYVTVRSDQPINLAGAFEKPIVSYEGGFEEKSEDALIKYADELYAKFTDAPAKEWLIGGNKTTAVNVNFKELLNELEKEIESYIAEEE